MKQTTTQPSTVLEDFRWQRKSRPSSLPSYHRRSLPCVREQPFAARCPAAVSRDIRAVPSSSKLKDLFWTRTSRLFTPSGYHLRSLLCARANSPLPHAAQQRIAATFVAHSLQPSGRIRVLHSGTAIGHDSRVQHSGVALGHRTRVQHAGTALGNSSWARHSRYSTRLQYSGIALGSTSLRCCALCS